LVENVRLEVTFIKKEGGLMNADVLTTKAADGIAVITLGSAKTHLLDAEMGDALTESLDGFAGGPTFA